MNRMNGQMERKWVGVRRAAKVEGARVRAGSRNLYNSFRTTVYFSHKENTTTSENEDHEGFNLLMGRERKLS